MSVSRSGRPTFDDPQLQHQIMSLRKVDNFTNLLCLARSILAWPPSSAG